MSSVILAAARSAGASGVAPVRIKAHGVRQGTLLSDRAVDRDLGRREAP
jgi:hypothetical protein